MSYTRSGTSLLLRGYSAASFFDFLACGGADFVDRDGELAGEIAVGKNFDTVVFAADELCLEERRFVDGGAILEPVEIGEIDDGVFFFEGGVVEAALGQAADEGHLAAFESEADRAAGAGFLAFVPLAGGLAFAGAFAVAEALGAMLGAGTGFESVEVHGKSIKAEGLYDGGFAGGDMLDFAADFVNFVAEAKHLQRCDGGFDYVGVVARAKGLGQHVANAGSLDDGTDAAAGNDACAGGSGLEKDASTAEFADDLVGNRVFADGNFNQGFASGIGGFADGLGDFVGLAEAEADFAGAVAGDDEGAEGEAATALDDLGASVDEDNFLGEIGFVARGVAATVALVISAFAGFSHT